MSTLICFIILHFKTSDETIRGINSLVKLDGIEQCKIIVFDNGSNNGSYEILYDKYNSEKNIIVEKSDVNLGFSSGNNEAYKIAKSYQPKYIITMNNDIQVLQKDFIAVLESIYNEKKFYVLGPDVYNPNACYHQSPLYPEYPSIEKVEKEMEYYLNIQQNQKQAIKVEISFRRRNLIKRYIPGFLIRLLRFLKSKVGIEVSVDPDKYKNSYTNPVLQGSFLIFSDLFIDRNDLLFEPDTRFYFEELLLALKCKTLGYETYYTPKLKVYHNHGVATKKSAVSIEDYLLNLSHNMLSAYQIFKETTRCNPWSRNH